MTNPTPEVLACLTPHQRGVAARVLAEEAAHRSHFLVSLSGAHAYGFPSPDSDLDVKAVHVDPATELLGFPRAPRAAERLEIVDGVEMDYSSNELGHVLLGVLKGNGNYLERFLSGFLFDAQPELTTLQPLIQASLSQRIARHYLGFGRQQEKEWEEGDRASAKRLLYVLRTTLTGLHGLLTGQLITDVTRLLQRYGYADAAELVEQKRRGEKAELPTELRTKWAERIPRLFEQLEGAAARSVLPSEPPNADALEQWLIAHRLTRVRAP